MGKVILLVEDSPDDAELMLRALRKNSTLNQVVVARDGAEALDYLLGKGSYAGRESSAMPGVVLLDLKLPKIDGLDVLKKIKSSAHTRFLPVVILSSSKEESDILNSYELGANSCVRKPVDFDGFVETAKQLAGYWLLLNEAPPVE
jgi:two-component system, response regulator